MKRPIPGGFLVAVEGIDGAGKTSVSAMLAQWCGERGLGCIFSKEPTSLKWGTELRASAKSGRLTLEKELEFFELDRKDHIERSIAPALHEGNIVILDRYYWSTAAYQGARGADVSSILQNHKKFAPQPDLVIVLDLDVDIGIARIRARGDKPNLFESKENLVKAREIFAQLAEQESSGVIIDSSAGFGETCSTVLDVFRKSAVEKIAHSCSSLHEQQLNLVSSFLGGSWFDGETSPLPSELKGAFDSIKSIPVC